MLLSHILSYAKAWPSRGTGDFDLASFQVFIVIMMTKFLVPRKCLKKGHSVKVIFRGGIKGQTVKHVITTTAVPPVMPRPCQIVRLLSAGSTRECAYDVVPSLPRHGAAAHRHRHHRRAFHSHSYGPSLVLHHATIRHAWEGVPS